MPHETQTYPATLSTGKIYDCHYQGSKTSKKILFCVGVSPTYEYYMDHTQLGDDIVVVTMHGSYWTGQEDDIDFSRLDFNTFVDDCHTSLHAYLAHAGLTREDVTISVYGHSGLGNLAAAMAATYPDDVDSVIMAGAPPHYAGLEEAAEDFFQAHGDDDGNDRIDMDGGLREQHKASTEAFTTGTTQAEVTKGLVGMLIAERYRAWVDPDGTRANPKEAFATVDFNGLTVQQYFVRAIADSPFVSQETAAILYASISKPVHNIAGQRDFLVPHTLWDEHAFETQKTDSAHYAVIEAPELFYSTVRASLSCSRATTEADKDAALTPAQ